jgi:integrase
MARPTTGSITEHVGKDGRTYRSLRFHAYGKRRRVPLGPVSAADAERKLGQVMADVERDRWQPPRAASTPAEAKLVPTFHEFAEEWWTRHEGQITAGTQADYKWRLQVHLSYFNEMRLDEITFDTVEQYIAAKLAEDDPLSARSINMTLVLLAQIMERALERELIARNPAKGKARRVKESKPPRSYLDGAGQIIALLDAAGELDREAPERRRHVERRAMLATLTFAGLRISELCALRWRDVDLATGRIRVEDSKTDAGVRKVKIRGALRDELLALRGRHQDAPQSAFVFATLSGGRMGADNFRNRVLGRPATVKDGKEKAGAGAIGRANKRLEVEGLPPLPDKLTPHSLRRTFCSLLYALGESPRVVMKEMGHTDPALALKVYADVMDDTGEEQAAQLRALVEGGSDAPAVEGAGVTA